MTQMEKDYRILRGMFILSLFPGWFQVLLSLVLGTVCAVAMTFLLITFHEDFFHYGSAVGIGSFFFLSGLTIWFWILMIKFVISLIGACSRGMTTQQLMSVADETSGAPSVNGLFSVMLGYDQVKLSQRVVATEKTTAEKIAYIRKHGNEEQIAALNQVL